MVLSGFREWIRRRQSPVATASADLRGALPRAIQLTWDFGMAPRGTTHLLCVGHGRFSLLFQVEREILSERGEAYARFRQKVIGAVREHFPQDRATLQ